MSDHVYKSIEITGSSQNSLEEAVELIKRNTRRYAKRQMTWFRAVEGVQWFPLDDATPDEAAQAILSTA